MVLLLILGQGLRFDDLVRNVDGAENAGKLLRMVRAKDARRLVGARVVVKA